MSTHDPGHAFACGTHVHAIKNGCTVANGPVQSTLAAPILRDLYEVEIEVAKMPGGRRVCLPPLEMSCIQEPTGRGVLSGPDSA